MSDERAGRADDEPSGSSRHTRHRIARRTLSHDVLERLLSPIRPGEFAVGSWLPCEPDLMQTFGVGRRAVREALQSLGQIA